MFTLNFVYKFVFTKFSIKIKKHQVSNILSQTIFLFLFFPFQSQNVNPFHLIKEKQREKCWVLNMVIQMRDVRTQRNPFDRFFFDLEK